ncbi:hypothetical protein [Tardiphaga sp.]|uniref:hypothetical protein n=1 Tax=Tardiphaga sp. TaxID=1926292 RepID=UPI0025D99CA3|nr:hypothetical protein [Tardiphaga sp.]
MPEVEELDPVGARVEPLGDVPAPIVLPDGFIALLAPLLTAPEVPAEDVPDPVEPALVEPAAPAEPPALPPV